MQTIECRADALEIASQYADLGCPMPVDLIAYLDSEGIVTDQSILDSDDDLDISTHYQQEI